MQDVVDRSVIEAIFTNTEEAKIFSENLKQHCYRRIDGFEYRWSYRDQYVDKPFGITITIDSSEGIETKIFHTSYEIWNEHEQKTPTVFEEIEFFLKIFEFTSRHIGVRKPTART
ncbi:hypothetical protein P9850_12175 [Anoxybacillus rupiensis]|uniref:Uncharacterized protein n=1 Tax=Anoxybacteroides rupiense TaxID=311460 RepID=A0ABD5IW82_9BACL|nr:hypothetical protein [Anoxybacillus rupiensis]